MPLADQYAGHSPAWHPGSRPGRNGTAVQQALFDLTNPHTGSCPNSSPSTGNHTKLIRLRDRETRNPSGLTSSRRVPHALFQWKSSRQPYDTLGIGACRPSDTLTPTRVIHSSDDCGGGYLFSQVNRFHVERVHTADNNHTRLPKVIEQIT
jgi:hypothetical protein